MKKTNPWKLTPIALERVIARLENPMESKQVQIFADFLLDVPLTPRSVKLLHDGRELPDVQIDIRWRWELPVDERGGVELCVLGPVTNFDRSDLPIGLAGMLKDELMWTAFRWNRPKRKGYAHLTNEFHTALLVSAGFMEPPPLPDGMDGLMR